MIFIVARNNFLRMKFRSILFVVALSQLPLLSAYADQMFSCSEQHRLTLYNRDAENRAFWGQVLSNQIVASCGFSEGHRYKNSDMGMFPSELAKKGLWIYRGVGNACSEGQLLIFNGQTNKVMILRNYEFSSDIFQCTEVDHF
jgi:hypothetical protein